MRITIDAEGIERFDTALNERQRRRSMRVDKRRGSGPPLTYEPQPRSVVCCPDLTLDGFKAGPEEIQNFSFAVLVKMVRIAGVLSTIQ
jgi:hypothetical protein